MIWLAPSSRLSVAGCKARQELSNVFRHGRWSGKVISSGLESVFVGDPCNGNFGAVGIDVGVETFWDAADIFRVRSNLFVESTDVYFGAVLTLKTSQKLIRNYLPVSIEKDSSREILLVREASVDIEDTFRTQNGYRWFRIARRLLWTKIHAGRWSITRDLLVIKSCGSDYFFWGLLSTDRLMMLLLFRRRVAGRSAMTLEWRLAGMVDVIARRNAGS